jgi:cell division septation protein DedD
MRRTAEKGLRTAAAIAGALAAVFLLYVLLAVGNPFALFLAADLPAAKAAPPLARQPAASPAAPPASLVPVAAPPLGSSGLSVLVASFTNPRDATRAETMLRSRNLPVYAVDLRTPDGIVTRRLFVGRFATRVEATQTQQRIASAFPSARVIAAFEERLP